MAVTLSDRACRATARRSGLRALTRVCVRVCTVRKRIAATSNVAQLTGVMKLVAASKLKGVEQRLERGRPFGIGLMNSVSFKVAVDPEDEDYKTELDTTDKKVLFLVMTTDRGLCGGVNSQIIRQAKTEFKRFTDAGNDCSMMVLGEKGKSGLMRTHADYFTATVDSAFDKDATFPLAAAIAGFVVEQDFNELIMLYSTYENAAKFTVTARSFPKISGLRTFPCRRCVVRYARCPCRCSQFPCRCIV